MSMDYSLFPTGLFRSSKWRTIPNDSIALYMRLWCLAAERDALGALVEDGAPIDSEGIAYMIGHTKGIDDLDRHLKPLTDAGLIVIANGVMTVVEFGKANPKTQAQRREEWKNQKRGIKTRHQESDEPPPLPPTEPAKDSEKNPIGIQQDSGHVGVGVCIGVGVNEGVEKEIGESHDSPPPPDSPPSKQKPKKSTTDERSSHPAILAIFHVTGKMPHKDIYEAIIDALGQSPNETKLKECWKAWRVRSYSPTNYAWATEWYLQGIPAQKQNYPARASPQTQSPPKSKDSVSREEFLRLRAESDARIAAQREQAKAEATQT